jgi:hypothetical protein
MQRSEPAQVGDAAVCHTAATTQVKVLKHGKAAQVCRAAFRHTIVPGQDKGPQSIEDAQVDGAVACHTFAPTQDEVLQHGGVMQVGDAPLCHTLTHI